MPDDPLTGDPASLKCHVCGHHRRMHHGVWICPRCDLIHDQ